MEQLTQVLTDTLREMKEMSSRNSGPVSTIEVPKFCPDDDGAQKWCAEVEKLGKTFHWTEFEQLTRAISGLTGEAKHWYNKWQPAEKTWENFKNEMSSLYPPRRNLNEKFRKASSYTSRNATSFCEYARTKISLIQALNFNLTKEQMLELVIGDIDNVHVKTAAFCSNVETVSELLSLLGNYEVDKRETGSNSFNKFKRHLSSPDNFIGKLCYSCRKPGHLQRDCPANAGSSFKQEQKNTITPLRATCNYCNKVGHTADKCFQKNKHEKRGYSNVNNFSVKLDDNFCIKFFIQGVEVNCLIDTGAECS